MEYVPGVLTRNVGVVEPFCHCNEVPVPAVEESADRTDKRTYENALVHTHTVRHTNTSVAVVGKKTPEEDGRFTSVNEEETAIFGWLEQARGSASAGIRLETRNRKCQIRAMFRRLEAGWQS